MRPWRYDAATELFHCTHDSCGYTSPEPDAVKLHAIRAHKWRKDGSKAKPPQERKRDRNCDHVWRLLRRVNPVEAHALDDGWNHVCTHCGTLKEVH